MKNEVLEDIRLYARNKLNQAYGFCGDASGSDYCLLSSTDSKGRRDIKITIEIGEERDYDEKDNEGGPGTDA